MKKINMWIDIHIEKIILYFILLGPFFDCLTALSLHILHTSFTIIMIFKILFLGILLYDLFFISKCRYKNKIKLIISFVILYMMLFIGQVVIQKGMDAFMYECQAMVRTFFFPLALLSFYNLYLEKRFNPNVKYLYYVLISYLLLILIPILTHTGFDSYAYSKVGTIGWFHSCNEVGGILSILFPFFFQKLLEQKKWIMILCMITLLGIYFSIGTKVPILSVSLTFFLFGLSYLIHLIYVKKWKQISYLGITVLVGIIALIMIVPKTSFYKNIQIHLDFLEIHSISDLLTIQKIDHFIFSERIKFLGKTVSNYEKAPWNQKLLGIGYIENYATDEVNTKLIEMDYYEVLFRHGIVGSILYFIPFIWILVQIVKKMKTHFSIMYLSSILLILLLSLFSGHIITAPSVSILVAYILILYLTEGKDPYES